MENTDLFYKLLIIRTPGVGPVKYNSYIARFGDAAAAAAVVSNESTRDTVLREMDAANKLGVSFICDTDDLYPDSLRGVKNHPPVLTVRGNVATLRRPMVSMVGTRHATAAGMEFMAGLATEFAARGTAVVSGMAAGCDTAAHRGALRANTDTATVAVLAGGVDYIWPLENESLYYKIIERGVVISEMPVGFVPVATNFVQRNRWVAGLGDKLILGEADMNSGSMRTVRFASDIGRDIYAIPSHPSDSRAMGPNSLIRSGTAKLCMGGADFFDVPKNETKKQKSLKNNETENSVLDKLGTIPVSDSVLAQIVKKDISEIKRELVVLELQGLVRKVDTGYVRA